MRRTLVTMMLLAGCSDPSAETDVPAPVQPTAVTPPEPVEPTVQPTAEPSALTDRDLDAMDEPALEAACFGGSSAACDRLGH